MQIIVVTQGGRKTRSLRLEKWQLLGGVAVILAFVLSGPIYATLVDGPNMSLLQRAVEIWDGTRNDHLVGRIGELRARIESIEASLSVADQSATDKRPSPPPPGRLQRQSFSVFGVGPASGTSEIDDLEQRASLLQAAIDRRILEHESQLRSVLQEPLQMPVKGYLSSGFGWRTHPIQGEQAFHQGVDLSAPAGTPVYATAPGVVTFIGPAEAYGKLVEITHEGEVKSRYAHLEGIEVTTGMAVMPRQRIGRVGSTGRSTGPHLHFELVLKGQVVNPLRFLANERGLRMADASTT